MVNINKYGTDFGNSEIAIRVDRQTEVDTFI